MPKPIRWVCLILTLLLFRPLTGQEIRIDFKPLADSLQVADTAWWLLDIESPRPLTVTELKLLHWDSIPDLQKQMLALQQGDTLRTDFRGDYEIVSWGLWEIDSLSAIITLQKPMMQTSRSDTAYHYSNRIGLRFWEEGIFRVTPIFIRLDLDGNLLELRSPTHIQRIVESGLMRTPADSIDWAPPKSILPPPPPPNRSWILYLVVGFALLGIVAAYLFLRQRRKRRSREEIQVPVPARELLLFKLKQLSAMGDMQPKGFATTLSYLMREHLDRQLRLKALEMPTRLILQQTSRQLDPRQQERLKTLLQQTDLIKYAKALPSDEQKDTMLDQGKQLIRELGDSNIQVTIPESQYIKIFGRRPDQQTRVLPTGSTAPDASKEGLPSPPPSGQTDSVGGRVLWNWILPLFLIAIGILLTFTAYRQQQSVMDIGKYELLGQKGVTTKGKLQLQNTQLHTYETPDPDTLYSTPYSFQVNQQLYDGLYHSTELPTDREVIVTYFPEDPAINAVNPLQQMVVSQLHQEPEKSLGAWLFGGFFLLVGLLLFFIRLTAKQKR